MSDLFAENVAQHSLEHRMRLAHEAERRIMQTEPELRSQKIKDIRDVMGKCLSTMLRGSGDVALNQFLDCVEMMVEAKIEQKEAGG